jgi:hypothetical protein
VRMKKLLVAGLVTLAGVLLKPRKVRSEKTGR